MVAAAGLTTAVGTAAAHADETDLELTPWWAGELSLSAGIDVSHGDYGDPLNTTLFYAPLSFAYLLDSFSLTPNPWDQLELAVTVPYLHLRGPRDFFVPGAVPVLRKTSERGLGDVVVRGTYIWYPEAGSLLPVAELSARWKIPTANEDRGLGTGEDDVALELALSRSFGRLTAFATLGYRFIGEPPGSSLDDAAYTSLGAGWRFGPRLLAGVEHSWIESASPFRNDAHELALYASWQVRERLALSPYGVAGLAGDGPDWAAGLTLRWTVPFGR